MKANPANAAAACVITALAASVTLPSAAQTGGQTYPAKPIHLIIPFPPGSSLDLVARTVGARMEESMSTKLVIEHRGGGNGMVGAESVAKAAPDGYTLMFTTPSSQVSPVYLTKFVSYDPQRDFTPIAGVVEAVTAIAVPPSFPANNVRELVDYVRANPGKLSYGSSGDGSYFHLLGEHFKTFNSIDIVHVPYKSIATAVSDVAGGHLPMAYTAVASTRPFIAAGKMKVLGVFLPYGYPGRYPQMPQHASVNETLPDYRKPPSWFAYFGPAKMPPAIVTRLNTEILKGAAAPASKKILEEAGFVLLNGSPQEFAALYRETFDVYGRIVKAAGLKPE
jgi:tripartite-type tricarboxylate transporter receptor subunit TctC